MVRPRNQDSEESGGSVLLGEFAECELGSTSDDELGKLHEWCRHEDAKELRLLEVWLVRERGESRGNGGGAAGGGAPNDGAQASGHSIGVIEARKILGVQEGATEEIVAAHRSLMTRLHPDKGGSTWLAARVNEAKRVLLAVRR